MGTLWVAKGSMFLPAENYDSDETAHLGSLIRVFDGHPIWVAKGSMFFPAEN